MAVLCILSKSNVGLGVIGIIGARKGTSPTALPWNRSQATKYPLISQVLVVVPLCPETERVIIIALYT